MSADRGRPPDPPGDAAGAHRLYSSRASGDQNLLENRSDTDGTGMSPRVNAWQAGEPSNGPPGQRSGPATTPARHSQKSKVTTADKASVDQPSDETDNVISLPRGPGWDAYQQARRQLREHNARAKARAQRGRRP
jgi:hypothetical protein